MTVCPKSDITDQFESVKILFNAVERKASQNVKYAGDDVTATKKEICSVVHFLSNIDKSNFYFSNTDK